MPNIDSSRQKEQDLDSPCCCSDKWRLRFNVDKYKLMHIGHSLPTNYNRMEGAQKIALKTVQEEEDLEVVIRSNLKSTSQCNKSVAAVKRVSE